MRHTKVGQNEVVVPCRATEKGSSFISISSFIHGVSIPLKEGLEDSANVFFVVNDENSRRQERSHFGDIAAHFDANNTVIDSRD